jgi:predicted GIY-YIG superfamily endonuclease
MTSETSVYQFFDPNGVVLYIGITSRSTRRQGEHVKTQEWWPLVASQSVEHFATRQEAQRREVELIRRFRPPFNVQHNPGHETVRLAYYAYREAAGHREDPLGLVRASKRQVALALDEDGERGLMLRTTPVFGSVAPRLVKPEGKVPLLFGGAFGGHVRAVEVEGATAVLHCVKQRRVGVGVAPFARVSVVQSRDGGGPRFALRNVQVCGDLEYRLLRKDVA